MNSRPYACGCWDIVKTDGTALANAWSMTWGLSQQNQLELTFQGLEASTKYRATILYE
jgi:hypothetical protein